MSSIKKVLFAVTLSFVMAASYMPFGLSANVQTAYAAEQVPTPTGLKWGSEYSETMAVWDWNADDDYYEDVDHYEGSVTWNSSDGTDSASKNWTSGATYGYDLKNFIDAKKGGTYTFTVKAIATAASGKEDSEEVTSAPQVFNVLSAEWKTLDENDSEIDADAGYGQIFLSAGGEGHQASKMPYKVTKKDADMELTVSAETGYVVKSVSFDSEPADLQVDEEKSTFKLDKDYKVSVVFKENNEKIDVKVDIGEGHDDLAAKVSQAINNDTKAEYKTEVDGTVLIVKDWPKASKAYKLTEYVEEYFIDAIEETECLDNGEMAHYGMKGFFGTKPLDQYESEDDLAADAERFSNINVDKVETYHVLWDKPIRGDDNVISAEVAAAKCGDKMSLTDGPEVSDKGSGLFILGSKVWWIDDDGMAIDGGKIEGDKTYKARFFAHSKFGYYIEAIPGEYPWEPGTPKEEPTVTVGGVEKDSIKTNVMGTAYIITVSVKAEHDWDGGKITKEATETAEGVKTYTCTACGETKTESIPKKKADPSKDPNKKGSDGTPVGPGASEAAADKAISGANSDADPKGSVYSKLKLKSSKQAKNAITLAWTKQSGAAKYVVYGNKCGKNNKFKKLGTYTGKSKKVTKVAGKKLKKGTYYKFIVVALDKNNMVVSTSKVIHVATKGGKVTNPKKVAVKKGKKKVSKVTVKKGKTVKVKNSVTKASKKLKLKKHRAVKYETSNKAIATVSSKGKIKGVKKGTAYVYAYAQNGVAKKIKVTVK